MLAVETSTLLMIAVVAVLTSMLTAVIGFGGGIILLAVLVSVLEPEQAIPVHAAIQLVSNGTRTYAHRRSVNWKIAAYMAWPLFFAAPIGLVLAGILPRSTGRLLIGVFVLFVTWKPWQLLPPSVSRPLPLKNSSEWTAKDWSLLGAMNGLLLPSIGATGVFLAPFLRNASKKRTQFLGTFGAQQSLGHLSKLVVFGVAGFAFSEHITLMLVGALGVAAGTYLGTRLGNNVSEKTFTVIYRVSITLVAIRLVGVSILDLA